MQFNILGPFEVVRDGERLELESFKRKSVLALLLINAPEAVSADRLIDELWGPDGSLDRQNALWVQISKLRTALDPDRKKRTEGSVLLTREPGYVLDVEGHDIDARRFEQAVGQGRALLDSDPATASLVLGEALAMWRGGALEDFAFESWAQSEIARLEELRLGAIEDRIEADLRRGFGGELMSDLEALVRDHPLRERFAAQRMLALYRSGRQADALHAYQTLNAQLGEHGLEPSGPVRQLEDQILANDPALLSPGVGVPGRPEPGLSIRGYEVLEKIGEGSVGVTYRALQPAAGREVVIKVIRAGLADDPEFIRRFEAEAQLVARLEHPHIVPLFDYWREPSSAYLVTPLLRGGSLDAAVANGPLAIEQASRLVDQISAALGTAHRQGIVHGNIKPSNIILDADENAYLADFGIVTRVTGDASSPEQLAPTLEPPFAAPEQLLGDGLTVRSDLFSFGTVIGFALTGRYPDDAGDWLGYLEPSLVKVITQATSVDPAARFSDAEALAAGFSDAVGAEAMAQGAVEAVENPYKGLRAFEESDAEDFFGRERFVERMVERLERSGRYGRFMAVVGPSGTGKSSVVKAGLLPALRRGAVNGSERWFIAEMTPGSQPFEQLERSLLRIAIHPPPGLLEQLTAEPDGLHLATQAILPNDDSQLLLVVDQFEEVFSLTDGTTRERFLQCLGNAISDTDGRLRLLVTLRADFYDRPLRNRELGELLRGGTEVIIPMSPEELERAIAGPAERVRVGYSSAALAEISAEVADQPNALPLLQHALTELFERRQDHTIDVDTYREVGGVAGALVRRADSLLEGLPDDARATAQQVFLRLVTVGEDNVDTRRRVPFRDLSALPAGAIPVEEVIQTFGRHRLLTFDRDPVTREPTVEVAHEALLQEWPTLRGWIEDLRDDLVVYRRFLGAATEWAESGHDPGYLLSGGRLAHFESWAATTGLTLTEDEERFLRASRDRSDALDQRRRSRRRLITGGFAAAAVIALLLAAAAFANMRRASAEAETRQELAAESRSRELAAASIAALDDDPELSILLGLESLAATDVPQREAVEALHQAVDRSRLLWRFHPGDTVSEPAYQSVGSAFFVVADTDANLHLFDSADAQPLGVLSSPSGEAETLNVSISPVTGYIATTPWGPDGGTVRLWDPATKRILWTTEGVVPSQYDAWFSRDGRWVATVTATDLSLWEAATGHYLWTVSRPTEPAAGGWITFDQAGEHVAVLRLPPSAVGTAEGLVPSVASPVDLTVFDRESGTEVARRTLLRSQAVEYSPDGQRIYSGNIDGTLAILDAGSLETVDSFDAHDDAIWALAVSPDGELFATGSAEGEIKVWEVETNRMRLTLRGHDASVVALAFSEGGDRVTSFAFDGTIRGWDVTSAGRGEGFAAEPTGEIQGLSISPDGGTIAVHTIRGGDFAPNGAAVTMWDVDTEELVRPPNTPVNNASFSGVDFSPSGDTYALQTMDASGTEHGEVQLLDPATGTVVLPLAESAGGDRQPLRFSPDGRHLATGGFGDDGQDVSSASVYDAGTGQLVQDLRHSAQAVTGVAFSPNGRHLATATCVQGRLVVWEWRTGQRDLFEQISYCLTSVVFSPTEPLVVTTGYEAPPIAWNLETEEEQYRLDGHTRPTQEAAFSPDGRLLATAGEDGTARIWDAADGAELLTIAVNNDGVGAIDFFPDGRHVAVGTFDGFVRAYTLDVDELRAIAESRVTRSLTTEECVQFNFDPCPGDVASSPNG